jgi:hypothetical protein
MQFAERGKYVCVRIGCRSVIQVADPTTAPECAASIQWILANAAQYEINPDRIGLWFPADDGDYVYTLQRGSAEVLAQSLLREDEGSMAGRRSSLNTVEAFFDHNLRGESPEPSPEARRPGRRGFGGRRMW